MLRFFIVLALLIVGGIVALAFLPLETALKVAGTEQSGMQWSKASGSLLSGRLEGLKAGASDYGTADLELDPSALLEGQLQYAVAWTGAHGKGTGKVSVSRDRSVTLKDYVVELDLLEYERAARWIRQSGGKVKLEGTQIRFLGNTCMEAVGVATSDVLDLNREILGSGWSELRGDLRCEEDRLIIPLQSENAAGTRFGALLKVAPGASGNFEARISGRISRALGFALPLAGFSRSGDEFVYVPKAQTVAAPAPSTE